MVRGCCFPSRLEIYDIYVLSCPCKTFNSGVLLTFPAEGKLVFTGWQNFLKIPVTSFKKMGKPGRQNHPHCWSSCPVPGLTKSLIYYPSRNF